MDLALTKQQHITRSAIFDLAGIAFIFFMPALTHLLPVPLYYAEPMRLVVLLALAHTHRVNAIALGLALPLFSFAVSSHPVLLKSGLISIELITNVLLFIVLNDRIKNAALSAFVSIALSKALYYALKFFFISVGLLQSELVSTPLWIQAVMTIVFSVYFFIVLKAQKE